jgi:hypothetical protein
MQGQEHGEAPEASLQQQALVLVLEPPAAAVSHLLLLLPLPTALPALVYLA